MSNPIYLDYHATTPVDPRVVEAMLPFFTEHYGNVASTHSFGKKLNKACDHARSQMAKLINAEDHEIVFTSGATESNNFAIKGVCEALGSRGRHIITCATEHKSVLDTFKHMQEHGFEITILPVDRYGQVSVQQVENALRLKGSGKDRTILVSLMAANNEIGTLHPINPIAAMLREHDVVFHVDGAQAVGKILFNVKRAGVDLLSMSGHKMYAPKGIGALYIDKTFCKSRICVQTHGGGQEFGLRAGTLAVPLVVAMGKAAEICMNELAHENDELLKLRSRLWQGIQSMGDVSLNGHPTERLPGNLSVCFGGLDGERLMICLRDIAVSSTSACSSGASAPSHVLKALGRSDNEATSTLRFGLGRYTTTAEIDYVIKTLDSVVKRLRKTAIRLQKHREMRYRSGTTA